MGFIPPKSTRLPIEPDGRMLCRTLLLLRTAGLIEQEELDLLASHARTCEAPAGVDSPHCPCPWCDALRNEYSRRIFSERAVRRFQLFDGEFEVGEEGEYDGEILERLVERSGSSWEDSSLLEKPYAKGYFSVGSRGEPIVARLVATTDEATATAARTAFEAWASHTVEWLQHE